jgi:hypothetical protein
VEERKLPTQSRSMRGSTCGTDSCVKVGSANTEYGVLREACVARNAITPTIFYRILAPLWMQRDCCAGRLRSPAGRGISQFRYQLRSPTDITAAWSWDVRSRPAYAYMRYLKAPIKGIVKLCSTNQLGPRVYSTATTRRASSNYIKRLT